MNRRVFIENSAVIPDFDSRAYYLTYEEGNALGASTIVDSSVDSSVDSLSPLFRINSIHVSELISTHRSKIDNYSFVYLSIGIEGPDHQILENFLAIGFIPDFISIEHNHNVFTQAIVKKLAFQYGHKLVFHNFFRNEYMLVKQI